MTTPNDGSVLGGTAVLEVAELARQAGSIHVAKFGDVAFAREQLHRLDADPRQAPTLEFYTLDGFAQYLRADGPFDNVPMIHVVSATQVDAISPLYGEHDHLRERVARAVCKNAATHGFQFNQPVALEALAIALQTCFQAGRGKLEELRKFTAGVRSTEELGLADDGVSQQVQAKAGVAAVVPVAVNNPWALAPWRTFAEVEQPVSEYVLRFIRGEKPLAGLFETGSAFWQVEAVRAIATYLRSKLGTGWTVLG